MLLKIMNQCTPLIAIISILFPYAQSVRVLFNAVMALTRNLKDHLTRVCPLLIDR